MSLNEYLPSANQIVVKQIREGIELLGFEGRNRFDIFTPQGELLGRAEERNQGFLGMLFRQVVGHWRRFSIEISDPHGQPILHAHHPFRFYFERLEISDASGRSIGAMEKRFTILAKAFVIHDELGSNEITMNSGLFKVWTFPFIKNGAEIATLRKKWRGGLTEVFTDADSFLIEFSDPSLSLKERQLLVASAIFIDLQYFENNKANLTSLLSD